METYSGVAADPGNVEYPGSNSRPLLSGTSLSKQGQWQSNLDRLVEELERLEARLENMRVAESASTTVLVGPIFDETR